MKPEPRDWPRDLRAIRDRNAAWLILAFAAEAERRADEYIRRGKMTGAMQRAMREVLKEIEE